MHCWWAEAHNTAICGCVTVFIGQQVGIIFSQGASCLGPARSPAYSRSLVGVDVVSVVTHTTTESVNDDRRHDYRFCFVLLWILWALKQLLSPAALQKWVKYRGHYTFILLLFLLLVFSAGDLKETTWNMIYVLFNHTLIPIWELSVNWKTKKTIPTNPLSYNMCMALNILYKI